MRLVWHVSGKPIGERCVWELFVSRARFRAWLPLGICSWGGKLDSMFVRYIPPTTGPSRLRVCAR